MKHRVNKAARMGRAALRNMICILAVFWAGAAHATCVTLVDAITLANEGFESGEPPDSVRLSDLNALITDMDNETILHILRSSGRAGDFGDLRNFLTQLKFMSQQMSPVDITLSDRFFADLSIASAIVQSACMLPDGSVRTAGPGEADKVSHSSEGIGATIRNHLKPLSSAQLKYLNESYNLALLSQFLVGFIVLTGVAVAVHYGVIVFKIMSRGRRICDVPASLLFMGIDIAGRVPIVGLRGCTFSIVSQTEDADAAALTEGTYCQIRFKHSTVDARVIRKGDTDLGIGFQEPLSRPALKALLAQSDLRPRHDFSLLRDAERRKLVFQI